MLTRTTKVVVLLKYKEELLKLKEFITKLQIYISYNNNSFETENKKVLFTILYFEDKAFEFIKTYLDDYNLYITNLKVFGPIRNDYLIGLSEHVGGDIRNPT